MSSRSTMERDVRRDLDRESSIMLHAGRAVRRRGGMAVALAPGVPIRTSRPLTPCGTHQPLTASACPYFSSFLQGKGREGNYHTYHVEAVGTWNWTIPIPIQTTCLPLPHLTFIFCCPPLNCQPACLVGISPGPPFHQALPLAQHFSSQQRPPHQKPS